jgi:hypothetical protein
MSVISSILKALVAITIGIAFIVGAFSPIATAGDYTINKYGNRYEVLGPNGRTTMQKYGDRWRVTTPSQAPQIIPHTTPSPYTPTFQQDPIGTALRNMPKSIQRAPELPVKCRKFGQATICD